MSNSKIFDVSKPPYNAKQDGSPASDAAIEAAMADARTVGGTVYFPVMTQEGDYPGFDDALNA